MPDMPDTETRAVLLEHEIDTTDVASVALLRHADDHFDTGRLCMMVTRKPIHIELTAEQEFRVISSLADDQVETMQETSRMVDDGEQFIPGLDTPKPGHVVAVFDSPDPTVPLPPGQYLVTYSHEGDVLLHYRPRPDDEWMPPAGPSLVRFHPNEEE